MAPGGAERDEHAHRPDRPRCRAVRGHRAPAAAESEAQLRRRADAIAAIGSARLSRVPVSDALLARRATPAAATSPSTSSSRPMRAQLSAVRHRGRSPSSSVRMAFRSAWPGRFRDHVARLTVAGAGARCGPGGPARRVGLGPGDRGPRRPGGPTRRHWRWSPQPSSRSCERPHRPSCDAAGHADRPARRRRGRDPRRRHLRLGLRGTRTRAHPRLASPPAGVHSRREP